MMLAAELGWKSLGVVSGLLESDIWGCCAHVVRPGDAWLNIRATARCVACVSGRSPISFVNLLWRLIHFSNLLLRRILIT
jgi:hypothetical protein